MGEWQLLEANQRIFLLIYRQRFFAASKKGTLDEAFIKYVCRCFRVAVCFVLYCQKHVVAKERAMVTSTVGYRVSISFYFGIYVCVSVLYINYMLHRQRVEERERREGDLKERNRIAAERK